MYLEKLEVQGFKSFANKNKLIFSGILNDKKRGITVVVGPNGSGKSNIADAIRWVLGEQSAKLLRSKKSEDVIFSGSDKKSRLNMAEVSLFLNNEKNNFLKTRKSDTEEDVLELERNKEGDSVDALLMLPEIVLTRRVFRDGNSEYLINNNKVRLSDIQIFLAKASFGQKTYSVIGQGMVENFLNTSPSERKSFFDEATGVRQYQIKRDISLNKLENSQENLAKVEMLLNEIDPRLKSLTRQVGKLKKRKSLEEALHSSQLEYYSKTWRELQIKFDNLNAKISESEKEKELLELAGRRKKNSLEAISQEDTTGEEFYKLQRKFLLLQAEREKVERQIERVSLWITLSKKENSDENEYLKSLNQEKVELQKIINESNENIKNISNSFLREADLEKAEESLSVSERELFDKNKELSRIEAWMEVRLEKQGRFDLSFLISRQANLKNDRLFIKDEIDNLNRSIESRVEKIAKVQKTIEKLDSNINEIDKELNRVNLEEQPSNIKKINQDLKRLLDKVSSVSDYGDAESVGKIMVDIKKAIQDLLNFSSGKNYSYKIENISNNLRELRDEKNKLSESLYSLRVEHNSEKNKKDKLEHDLLKTERESLDLDNKIKSNENEDRDEISQNQKNKLEIEIGALEKDVKKLKDEKNKIRLERESWQEKKIYHQDILQKTQNKLNEINNKISLIKTDSLKSQAKMEDLFDEIRANFFSDKQNLSLPNFLDLELGFIEDLLATTDNNLLAVRTKIDNFNQEQEIKKRALLDLQREINNTENNIGRISGELNNYKIELAREETRMEDVSGNVLNDGLDIEKIKKHKLYEDVDIVKAKEEIGRLKNQLEMIGGIDPEAEREYEETKKRYDFLFEQTEDLNKTIKSLEKVILELDIVIKDRFEAEFKVISEKFNEYFKVLFSGGNAKIFPINDGASLDEKNNINITESKGDVVDSKNLQSSKNIKIIRHLKKFNALGFSGVDISATPPGKKIASVNMLSGGERALTAIALICAIISSNPAPFVVLDEVDASLDEANSERLAKILDDLSNKTQFIAISHNRATMKRANILYGVTMQDDGVSKLLSVKIGDTIEDL